MRHHFRTIRCWLIAAIITFAAGAHLWFWPQNTDLPRLTRSFFHGDAHGFTAGWRKVDSTFAFGDTTGDLAVDFADIAPNDELGARLAGEISHRGSYVLYPRRVITANDGVRINDGATILATRFRPSDEWLADRHVEGIFTFKINAKREPEIRFDRVPPKPAR